jgi:hypothetical protein
MLVGNKKTKRSGQHPRKPTGKPKEKETRVIPEVKNTAKQKKATGAASEADSAPNDR